MDLKHLRQLAETPGVSGREHLVRLLLRSMVEAIGIFDEVREDNLGNLICVRTGKRNIGRRRILAAAHMDQAGFLVSHICDEGYLRLHPVGTFDPRSLASQSVSVVSREGNVLPGTIHLAAQPVHTITSAATQQMFQITDFYVDLGLSFKDVKKTIRLGDMVVFRTTFEEQGSEIVSAGLDDRIGCWALIEAMALIENEMDDIICAFTVQEELGSRGVGPVAYGTSPDFAIICETVVSAYVPGVPRYAQVTVPGRGIALQVADSSLISDSRLVELAERVAEERGLPIQHCLMQGGGQDGAIVERSGLGVRTLALGCPLKFMHTSREHANRADVESYPFVIAALIDNL